MTTKFSDEERNKHTSTEEDTGRDIYILYLISLIYLNSIP